MKVGYARVSTGDQHLDLQVDALKHAGCVAIFTDQGVSGRVFERPGLTDALRCLGDGDTLMVWKLDRLGRSLAGLVELVNHLGARSVQFASLSENIDTATAGGVLVFHMMAALAEFERTLISERTRAGLSSARTRGRAPGRPRALSEDQCTRLIQHLQNGKADVEGLAKDFHVSPRTLHRYIHRLRLQTTP